MPTPAEILQDPNFTTLSPADRHAVMLRVDPDGFGKLAPNIQGEVIGAPDFAATAASPARTWRDEAIDFAKGAGAGAMSTVFHGGDLIRRGLGMERVIDRPEVQAGITAPDSTAGQIGNMVEQGAEFLIPGGGGTGGVLRRALTTGGKAAAVRTAQTGDPVEGIGTGAVVAAVPATIGAARAASPTIKNATGATAAAAAKFAKRSSLLRPLAHPVEAVEAVKGGVKDFRVRQAFDAATKENAAKTAAKAEFDATRREVAAKGKQERLAKQVEMADRTRQTQPQTQPATTTATSLSLSSGRVPGPAPARSVTPRPAPAWRTAAKQTIAEAETTPSAPTAIPPAQPPVLPSGRVPGRFREDALTRRTPPAQAPAVTPAPAPTASASPAAAPSRFQVDVPAGHAEHYGETGQAFGNRMATNAAAKDAAIIKHLASKGITPEQFASANEALRNTWLKQVNAETGTKYSTYRGSLGEESAARLLKTWKWAAGGGNPNY
jgi:hypothetical protein